MAKWNMQAGYVVLLPLFFLLHNYNELFGFIPLSHLLLFGLGIYLFAATVLALAWLATRSLAKAFFISFVCLVFMLFWGALHDFIKSHVAVSRYAIVLPAALVFFIASTWYVLKRPLRLQRTAGYISVVVLILCLLDIVQFIDRYRQFRKDDNLIYPIQHAYTPCHQPKPDIYFIIFDEYTNNRTLQRHWQYDNSGITNWLTQRGFYCPDSSKANYSYTPYSISSILNMNYLPVKKGDIDELPVYTLKAVQSMSNNETISYLQKAHYNFHFISPFNNTIENLDIDREFDGWAVKKLFNHTFPGRIRHDFTSRHVDYKKKDSDSRLIIDRIKMTANADTNRPPQFVYGHLMTTHRPHIYDSLGNIRTAAKEPLFNTYLSQVKQANKQIQELVAHLQAHNRQNTIIIIQGDHGFRRLPDTQTSDYFPNFTAFYFPGKAYPPALANISAVNTFRIVFNQYFCQNFKLLKDSSIIVKY